MMIEYSPSSPALFVLPLASCVFRSRSACFAISIGSCELDIVLMLLEYGLEVRDSFLPREPKNGAIVKMEVCVDGDDCAEKKCTPLYMYSRKVVDLYLVMSCGGKW